MAGLVPYLNGENGTRRWHLVISVAGIVLVIAGGVLTFLIQVATLNTQVAAFGGQVTGLQTQLNQLNERDTLARDKLTELAASLTEIETQFCASDIVRNLMHANEMRVSAMLWSKLFDGQTYPTDNAYYPTICNRKIHDH